MMDNSLIGNIARALPPGGTDPMQLSPLVLAYVGDTVYDLYVRTALVMAHDATVHTLHMLSSSRVCAKAQAAAYFRIEDRLTEQEKYIYKRGRNSHMGTVPRNAEISDYRAATGLEALIGYLYLSGSDARLCELMELILSEE